MPVEIGAARPSDLPALKDMIEGAYRGDHARMGWTHEADLVGGERIEPEELVTLFADPNVAIFVARQGADIVGCVTVTDNGALAYLGLLCVDPPFQSAGLGSRLLTTAETLCGHLGSQAIEMTVIENRTELIAWYERAGYVRTGERRPFPVAQPVPLHFVVLEKRLASA
ncbi:GNAT family N-acetyltransferase [Croceicoccus naphthovorans]|uniref:GNAT family N-acetyltransferase n=1 Tax=Croceicoccus naphthovorans TaxID=1348774 RepID=UPI00183A9C6B|nr:GNAT family N-acetyltransferase [Croceicoccus naphthovorans]MBB3990794.1 ribosomal protein S18 acetylase RimI-like enzyme [Croceicoccus naphthovorans]